MSNLLSHVMCPEWSVAKRERSAVRSEAEKVRRSPPFNISEAQEFYQEDGQVR